MSDGSVLGERPEISVYWRPGCSMCLKMKEFLEGLGIPFESLNVLEREDALEEMQRAGLRGVPALRQGDRFIFAQSVEVIADFLGISFERGKGKLSEAELLERWEQILLRAHTIVSRFTDEQLQRPAIVTRKRPIKDLSSHVFQIAEGFVMQIEERAVLPREFQNEARPELVSRRELLPYVDRTLEKYQTWLKHGGPRTVPDQIEVYYGIQPSYLVVERSVWHSTQHARQLDAIAVGMGAEYEIVPELYAGLPLPKRMWA